MSRDISAFVIVLDENIGEEQLVDALVTLRNIKNVLSVEPYSGQLLDEAIARSRITHEVSEKLVSLIRTLNTNG